MCTTGHLIGQNGGSRALPGYGLVAGGWAGSPPGWAADLPARRSRVRGLPGGAGEVGGDDVGGVPVQAAAGPVIPHRGPRVRVRCGFLHVPQRHPDIAAVMNACRSV